MSSVTTGVVFVLMLLLALGGPLVLYALIQSETDDVSVMDREAAERTARSDSGEERDTDAGWGERRGRKR